MMSSRGCLRKYVCARAPYILKKSRLLYRDELPILLPILLLGYWLANLAPRCSDRLLCVPTRPLGMYSILRAYFARNSAVASACTGEALHSDGEVVLRVGLLLLGAERALLLLPPLFGAFRCAGILCALLLLPPLFGAFRCAGMLCALLLVLWLLICCAILALFKGLPQQGSSATSTCAHTASTPPGALSTPDCTFSSFFSESAFAPSPCISPSPAPPRLRLRLRP
jgi:hypothetical protein